MSYIKRMLSRTGKLSDSVIDFLESEGFEDSPRYYDGYQYGYRQGKVAVTVKYGRIMVETFSQRGDFEKSKCYPFDNDDFTSFKTQYYKAVDYAAIHV